MRKKWILPLLLLLLASPAAAQREFKLLNPTSWLNIGQQVVSNECGWLVGKPFVLDGRPTQLALQVFTGNTAQPAFLAAFDDSDSGAIAADGGNGLILRLRGGTYQTVQRADGFRLYRVGNQSSDGWEVLARIKKAKVCGARADREANATGFFDAYGYLVAGAVLSEHPDLFEAYFAGRLEEVLKLASRAASVLRAAERFPGYPELQPPVEELPSIPVGCDVAALRNTLGDLQSMADAMGEGPTKNEVLAVKAFVNLAVGKAAACQ